MIHLSVIARVFQSGGSRGHTVSQVKERVLTRFCLVIIRTTKSREKASAARVVSAFPPLLESVSKRLAHCKSEEKYSKYLCSTIAPLQDFPKWLQTVFTTKSQRNSVSRAVNNDRFYASKRWKWRDAKQRRVCHRWGDQLNE